MRLAAWSFIVSAASITNTRRADSNGVRVAAATTGSSMSPTSISAAPDGVTHVRSGWQSARDPLRDRVRSARAVGQQRRRERARDRPLARARRAVEQVRVRRPAPRRQRRLEHRARVRVRVDARQQLEPIDDRRQTVGSSPRASRSS